MVHDSIVFGLVDNGAAIADPAVASKYRDLTIAWSRYDYRGPIIEAPTLDDLLATAAAGGSRYLFARPFGHLIRERWDPELRSAPSFLAALRAWIERHEFLVAGEILESGAGYGLRAACLVVDLERYRAAGRPRFGGPGDAGEQPAARVRRAGGRIEALRPSPEGSRRGTALPGWRLIAASLVRDLPVLGLPAELTDAILDLEPEDPGRTRAFSRYLGGGIESYGSRGPDDDLGRGQREFLGSVARQARRARHGVFLLNIEPYTDVERPPEGFRAPLSSLFSVASGFKPDRILATHGFSADTTVTFFDYSARALAIRKRMVASWDGEDLPGLVRELLRRYPPSDTFYQLWEEADAAATSLPGIEPAWRAELARWGGAAAFRDHWSRTRGLRREYLHLDLLEEPERLLGRIGGGPSSVIWYSNAFFTMFANWHYTAAERRARYERFVAALAEADPDLYLYGSDYNNSNVNFVRAGEYWREYCRANGSELDPPKLHRHEIRM